jgi:hypothetical protein
MRPDSQIMIIPIVQLQDVLCAMLSLSMRLGIVVCADMGNISANGDTVQLIQKRINAFRLHDELAFGYLVHLQKKFKQAGTVRSNQILLGLGVSQLARTDVLHCADADSQPQSKYLSSDGKTLGSVGLE